jgi:hypothetical protein
MKTLLSILLFIPLASANVNYSELPNYYTQSIAQSIAQSEREWLMQTIETVADTVGVPANVLKAIAWNESRYKWVIGAYGDMGYFQIIPSTYDHWKYKLNLGDNKYDNNVVIAAHYLKYLHNRYGSWYKARFAYGRGHWRDSSTWTAMEKEFMRNFVNQI